MKKTILIFLLLFSTLLVGCTKKETTGGANTTHPKVNLKDIYTKDYFEQQKISVVTVSVGTIQHESAIVDQNWYLIQFASNKVYSTHLNKDLDFEPSMAVDVDISNHYIYVENPTEYLIFHTITLEKLHTLPKDSTKYAYTFERFYILVEDIVDGENVFNARYNFLRYQPVDNADPSESPLILPGSFKINDYTYDQTANGVIIYKDDAFYAHYYYEAAHDNSFFLANGNILTQHKINLPEEALEYDYIESGVKYKLMHYLFEVSSKKVKVVDLPINILSLQSKSEETPYNVDNYITFNTIDAVSKTIVKIIRQGALSNSLKVSEIVLDFGTINSFKQLSVDTFFIRSGNGLFLVNGENKIINSIYIDYQNYSYFICDDATIIIYNDSTTKAFIYDLKDGKLLYEGYTYITVLTTGNRFALEKDDEYYIYDNGNLEKIDGEFEELFGQPFYRVEKDGLYTYYHLDGTTLFKSDVVATIKAASEPVSFGSIRIFTYTYLGDTYHTYHRTSYGE